MIKGVFLLKRKPAFLRADFKRYWKDVHAPLVLKLPGLRRYVLSHAVDEAYEWAEPRWDGVAHLYFDDAQAAERALVSDTFINESYPDVDKFVSVMTGMWVQEHHILPVEERPKWARNRSGTWSMGGGQVFQVPRSDHHPDEDMNDHSQHRERTDRESRCARKAELS